MILMDEAYARASERTAQQIEALVRERFRDTLGEEGEHLLDEMHRRMQANINSDSRT